MSEKLEWSPNPTTCPSCKSGRFFPVIAPAHMVGSGKCFVCNEWYNIRKGSSSMHPDTYTKYVPPTPNEQKPQKPKTAKERGEKAVKVREHIYKTADGAENLLKIEVMRYSDGEKFCPQKHWDGTKWEKGGVQSNKLTLYHAHSLTALQSSPQAIKDSTTVYVPEGEKDVETLEKAGEIATCNPMGAGKWNQPQYNELLRGLNVVILPDNDTTGREHGAKVFQALQGIAASVKIVNLWELMPDLMEKGDVSDFIAAGGKIADVIAKAESTPIEQPSPISAPVTENAPKYDPLSESYRAEYLRNADLPEPVFVIEQLLCEGLSCIAGRPKKGKSWLALDACLSVTRGGYFLGKRVLQKGAALYCALEDNQRRMKKRLHSLEQNGNGFPDDLHILHKMRALDCGGWDDLKEFVKIPNLKIIVIDTIAKVRAQKRGKDNYQEDYKEFGALQRFALEHNVCIVLIMHTVKGTSYTDPFDCISGTTGITGAFDGMMVIQHEPAGTVLHGTGRDTEDFDLAIKLMPNGAWQLLGNASEFFLSEERKLIVDALFADGNPLRPHDVAEITGLSHGSVRKMMGKMLQDGLLTRDKSKYQLSPTQVIKLTSSGNSGNSGNSWNSSPPTVKYCPECNKDNKPEDLMLLHTSEETNCTVCGAQLRFK